MSTITFWIFLQLKYENLPSARGGIATSCINNGVLLANRQLQCSCFQRERKSKHDFRQPCVIDCLILMPIRLCTFSEQCLQHLNSDILTLVSIIPKKLDVKFSSFILRDSKFHFRFVSTHRVKVWPIVELTLILNCMIFWRIKPSNRNIWCRRMESQMKLEITVAIHNIWPPIWGLQLIQIDEIYLFIRRITNIMALWNSIWTKLSFVVCLSSMCLKMCAWTCRHTCELAAAYIISVILGKTLYSCSFKSYNVRWYNRIHGACEKSLCKRIRPLLTNAYFVATSQVKKWAWISNY